MCLAVPGRILSYVDDDPLMPMARVAFGGITKEICTVYVPGAQVGDYVLVHAGFAIARLDERAATRRLSAFAATGAS